MRRVVPNKITAANAGVPQFQVKRIALVTGYSMGAWQTYEWAVQHPELVERIAPFCGTARTTAHLAGASDASGRHAVVGDIFLSSLQIEQGTSTGDWSRFRPVVFWLQHGSKAAYGGRAPAGQCEQDDRHDVPACGRHAHHEWS